MDFDLERELENAGIDAFDFSMMDESERRKVLEEACLDPNDYEFIEHDSSFSAWSDLQNAGLSLSELEYMDEDEKRKALRDAGLDPEDYDSPPIYIPSYSVNREIPPVTAPVEPAKPEPDLEPIVEPAADPLIQEPAEEKPAPAQKWESPLAYSDTKRRDRDPVLAAILGSFVILLAIILLASINDRERTRQEEQKALQEERALQQAEEKYQEGLEQFAAGEYDSARNSFRIASGKKIGESEDYYDLCRGIKEVQDRDYDSAELRFWVISVLSDSEEIRELAEKFLAQAEKEHEAYDAEQEKIYLEWLADKLPYIGMPEKYIGNTALGKPSPTVRHNSEMVDGKVLPANIYDYTKNGYVIYTARCVDGKVTNIWDRRSNPYKQSSGSGSSKKKSGTKKDTKDPYNAKDYYHAEDFYEYYYDDFYDYEEAEDYWEAHH